MIGNLLASFCFIGLSASVVFAGDVQARNVADFTETNSVSHITGDNVIQYLSFVKDLSSYAIPNNNVVFDNCYDSNGNVVSGAGGMYSSADISTTLNTLTLAENLSTDYIHLLYSKDGYVVNARLLVPSSFNEIINIEFSLTGTFNYGTFTGMYLYRNNISNFAKYPLTSENNLIWYGFNRNVVNSNGLATDVGFDGFNFYDFGFSFTTSADTHLLHFDFLSQYSNSSLYFQAYNNGYSAGYNAGAKDGWSKGYADAMALVDNHGSFNNLFNSIADTPLRFLYGLFSFDLFGTSVLVIVLTLLTGIAVFGIVKKVWK